MLKTFKNWLPVAFLAIVLSGLIYAAVQQSLRQSANDPQTQMAEDASVAISNGTAITSLVPTGIVNIAQSLSPYIVFYNDAGSPVAGNGILNGSLPALPSGIFAYMRNEGEDRITWQPEPGVRSAIVVVRINGSPSGFVMAGRSLREVEAREDQLELVTCALLIFALIGTFVLEAFKSFF